MSNLVYVYVFKSGNCRVHMPEVNSHPQYCGLLIEKKRHWLVLNRDNAPKMRIPKHAAVVIYK